MQAILHGLRGSLIVGADIVEVSPPFDHAQLTGLAAATLAYELICLMAIRSHEPKLLTKQKAAL